MVEIGLPLSLPMHYLRKVVQGYVAVAANVSSFFNRTRTWAFLVAQHQVVVAKVEDRADLTII